MDSDLILRLSAHPNIAGVKHTDHDVGKMCREMASTKKSREFLISFFRKSVLASLVRNNLTGRTACPGLGGCDLESI
jgi:dihydrodipicolinate synthase/N-acetylneuraminate lyase